MEIGKLLKTYIKIRDERSTLKAEYSEKDSRLMSQLDKIKEAINEYSEVNSLESARTSEGSFYRSSKTRYWTSDWDSMYKFVLENKLYIPEIYFYVE